jgi:hypothetical protein
MTLRELRDAIDGLGLDAAEHQPALFYANDYGPFTVPVEMAIATSDIHDSYGNVLISEGNPYLCAESAKHGD